MRGQEAPTTTNIQSSIESGKVTKRKKRNKSQSEKGGVNCVAGAGLTGRSGHLFSCVFLTRTASGRKQMHRKPAARRSNTHWIYEAVIDICLRVVVLSLFWPTAHPKKGQKARFVFVCDSTNENQPTPNKQRAIERGHDTVCLFSQTLPLLLHACKVSSLAQAAL